MRIREWISPEADFFATVRLRTNLNDALRPSNCIPHRRDLCTRKTWNDLGVHQVESQRTGRAAERMK